MLKKIFLLNLIFVFFLLFFSKNIYASTYYVSPTGLDNNTGSLSAPWKTFNKAVNSILSGDTLIFRAGIYKQASFEFKPAGTHFYSKTTFKAYPNERVLLTSTTNYPPDIFTNDYITIDGLWIGGIRNASSPEKSINLGGTAKEILNSTIFGYNGNGINFGSSQFHLIKGNRLVKTGKGTAGGESHGMYFQGGYSAETGAFAQHLIIDNNIIINGEGYGITGWHKNKSDIVMRNFVANHFASFSSGGKDYTDSYGNMAYDFVENNTIIANNVSFSSNDPHQNGSFLPVQKTLYINNVHLPNSDIEYPNGWIQNDNGEWVQVINLNPQSNTFEKNALPVSYPTNKAKGNNPILYSGDDPFLGMGSSKTQVQQAINSLNTIFSLQNINSIYSNTQIEPHFATIRNYGKTPIGTMQNSGYNLLSQFTTNIGWGTYFPNLEDFYWKMFDQNGLTHFNRFEKVTTGPKISNVQTTNPFLGNGTSKTINWNTNIASISRVIYWPTNVPADYKVYTTTNLKTQHTVQIENLIPCDTGYTFLIIGRGLTLDALIPSFYEGIFKTATPPSGCTM